MKKILSFAAGLTLLLAFGTVFAADSEYRKDDGTMIKNDDLDQYKLDQEKATVNQAPAVPGAEGSAPGGISPDPGKIETDMTVPPEEKMPLPEVKTPERKSWDGY